MNNSLCETFLKEGEGLKRPIDFYIEGFEQYKAHCQKSAQYLLYYFAGHIICQTIHFLVLWIWLSVSVSFVDIFLNLCAYLLWYMLFYHFQQTFRVFDPHSVNTKQILFLFIIKLPVFKYYLIFCYIIFVLLIAIHSIFPYQLIMVIPDFTCLLLTIRVILQVKFKEQNLDNQIKLIKSSKTFIIQQFIMSNEKQPLEIIQIQDNDQSENASLSPIKLQGFLPYYKPKKISKLLDVQNGIDETQLYSH